MSANVALTDTFDQWRVKTNEVVVMTQSDGMSNFIKLLDTTNSTSNTTGSIITAGGVGIAKSAVIGENLRIHGNVITDGDTTISGNLVFGDAITDQITFTADINSSITPNANLTFNLGNTTMLWANTWTGHLGVTQKTDSGKPAVTVVSTDVDALAVSVTASQTTADVLDIAADSVTTAKVIDITSDALTTGSALYIDSDSSSTSTRSIATIIQNHASATGSTGLTVQADAGRGLFVDSNLAAGGYALEIDAEITTTNTAKIAAISTSGTTLEIASAGVLTGKVVDITADAATTGTGIFMSMDGLTSGKAIDVTTTGTLTGKVIDIAADSATTGTGINMSMDALTTGSALVIDCDSADTGTRNIASITQNHASGTGATVLALQADAGRGLFVDSNLAAGGYAIEVDSEQTTTNVAKIASIATSGTLLELSAAGVLTGDVLNITADASTTGKGINMSMDGLTTGSALYIDDNSADTGTRSDVSIIQNNAAALAATALTVQSDGGITGVTIDKNFTDVAAATVTGLHVDFDRTVPGSGTAAFTDIGINLDVTAAGLGTTTTTGLDVDVVGATSGAHTATGINIAVGSADTNYALITSGGNVGISTAAPSTALHVTGVITETSMREMKTNISNMENMLPAVLQMQGVKFDFKDEGQGTDNYGFIAEDVENILPNIVSYNEDGKPQGIQYSKMTAVLLEAIKEQQVQIDELKSKLN